MLSTVRSLIHVVHTSLWLEGLQSHQPKQTLMGTKHLCICKFTVHEDWLNPEKIFKLFAEWYPLEKRHFWKNVCSVVVPAISVLNKHFTVEDVPSFEDLVNRCLETLLYVTFALTGLAWLLRLCPLVRLLLTELGRLIQNKILFLRTCSSGSIAAHDYSFAILCWCHRECDSPGL